MISKLLYKGLPQEAWYYYIYGWVENNRFSDFSYNFIEQGGSVSCEILEKCHRLYGFGVCSIIHSYWNINDKPLDEFKGIWG